LASLFKIVYLLIRFFYCFAAGGAFCILEELMFPAPFILAPYHQMFAAGVAFGASRESLPAAYGARSINGPAAP